MNLIKKVWSFSVDELSGKQNEAIPLYKEGCKLLCNDLKCNKVIFCSNSLVETNPQVINGINEKIKGYLGRVEYLEKHITPCYDEAISLLNKAVQYDQNGINSCLELYIRWAWGSHWCLFKRLQYAIW